MNELDKKEIEQYLGHIADEIFSKTLDKLNAVETKTLSINIAYRIRAGEFNKENGHSIIKYIEKEMME